MLHNQFLWLIGLLHNQFLWLISSNVNFLRWSAFSLIFFYLISISLDVSQDMHKITNLWKCCLNWSSNLQVNNERKTPLFHFFVCFQIHKKRLQLKSIIIWVGNYLSQKLTSEGDVSHNVLSYQQLSIALYQEGYYVKIILSNF